MSLNTIKYESVRIEDMALSIALRYHFGDYIKVWIQYSTALIALQLIKEGSLNLRSSYTIGPTSNRWRDLYRKIYGTENPFVDYVIKKYIEVNHAVPSGIVNVEKMVQLTSTQWFKMNYSRHIEELLRLKGKNPKEEKNVQLEK